MQNDGPQTHRGTILVASGNTLFADIVCDMVATGGFSPAHPLPDETWWLALQRTHPCIVICDCTPPAPGIQRLIAEASSRHIPLVLSDTRMPQSADLRDLALGQSVVWFTFPISRAAFVAMLNGLLPPFAGVHAVSASVAGVTIAAVLGVHTLTGATESRDQFGSPVPDDVTDRPRGDHLVDGGLPDLADAADARSALAAELAAKPVYEQSLRRVVWAYVVAEREAGALPGHVLMAVTELIDAARIVPSSVAQALTRRTLLWCVEAYFEQHDDGPSNGEAAIAAPMLVSNR